MKIFFYINIISGGGAERVVANLSSQFSEHGHSVGLITSFSTEKEYQLNSNVKRFNLEKTGEKYTSRITKNIYRIKKIRDILKNEKPDVIISFMEEPNFRTITAAYGLPVKTIVSVRNDPNLEYAGKIGKFIGKFILPLADGCVFQTEDAKSWFPRKLQRKSTIIANAVNRRFFDNERRSIKDRIVTVGRLNPQKNQKLLIDSFSEISKDFSEAKLYIYGEGSLKAELINEIENLSLTERVFLKGNVSNIPLILSEAEIFVLTSDYEGMPNALMEAMASGLAVISTDCPCGGPKMLIDNKVDGILVPTKDKKALTDSLRFLLENKDYSRQMGDEARKKAESFRGETIYESWEKYVLKVLRGKIYK